MLMMLYFSDSGFDEISDLVCDIYFFQYNVQFTVTSVKSMNSIYVNVTPSNNQIICERTNGGELSKLKKNRKISMS